MTYWFEEITYGHLYGIFHLKAMIELKYGRDRRMHSQDTVREMDHADVR